MVMQQPIAREKVTIPLLLRKKAERVPIVMLSVWDYPHARACDETGLVDIFCVSDTEAAINFGHKTNLSVTFEEVLLLVKAVARATRYGMVMADMPYMSYHKSREQAVDSAARLVAEGGAEVMKCEADAYLAKNVEAIARAGIPVMGHIGMTPMTAVYFGGFKLQGDTAEKAKKMVEDAIALEQAGCFALLIEWAAAEPSAYIASRLKIPVISLGAGPHCDGVHIIGSDLFYNSEFMPQHSKWYVKIRDVYRDVYRQYGEDVLERRYPAEQHYRRMQPGELEKFEREFQFSYEELVQKRSAEQAEAGP
jgi:3-methyl-2-oxobutanoate hydroxymethyltransferase